MMGAGTQHKVVCRYRMLAIRFTRIHRVEPEATLEASTYLTDAGGCSG